MLIFNIDMFLFLGGMFDCKELSNKGMFGEDALPSAQTSAYIENTDAQLNFKFQHSGEIDDCLLFPTKKTTGAVAFA